jgi:hypothetical protein
MKWKFFKQKYLDKSLLRTKMIIGEYFQKSHYYSFSYAFYSSIWWISWYAHLSKVCMWSFKKKDEYIKIYLKTHYGNIIDDDSYNNSVGELLPAGEYPIWIFWYQGFENAPILVKTLLKNQIRLNGKNVRAVDSKTLNEYIELPKWIEEKRERKVISLTHYSDIVRVSLLAKYGGIWLDATCYVSEKIPQWVTKSDFYSCRTIGVAPLPIWSNSRWCSWGQGTCRVNFPLYTFIRDMYFAYWKNEDCIIDYLILDALMDVAYCNIPIVNKAIKDLPANNIQRNGLWYLLNKPYDKEKYLMLTSDTWLFKLSYKSTLSEYNNNAQTFYHHLLNNNL